MYHTIKGDIQRFFNALAFILALSIIFPTPEVNAKNKNLVIINSYNESATWPQDIVTTIMQHLSEQEEAVSTDVIHLNGTLVHNAKEYDEMANGVFERYQLPSPPDYVILIGNFSFSMRDWIVRRWGKLPMVLIAQNDKYGPEDFYYTYNDTPYKFSEADMYPLEPLQQKYNFTLVYQPNLYEQTIDLMKDMFPGMKKLVFLSDELYISHGLSNNIHAYLQKKYPSIEYEWLKGNRENGAKMRAYLDNPDFNIGLLISTWFYADTTVHGFPALISGDARMLTNTRHPVFAMRSAYFKLGVIGGCFPSPEECNDNIRDAVDLLVSDYDMSKVPFYYPKKSFPIINYKRLIEYHLPQKICPADTVFVDKPKSFWEANRYIIISSLLGMFGLLGLAIGYMIFQRRRLTLLNTHKQLIASMPIAYTEATVIYDRKGKVEDIKYRNGNTAFQKLLQDNRLPDTPHSLFNSDYISTIVEGIVRKGKPVRFNYYFKQTDKYYEFLISLADLRDNDRMSNVNVFAIDVTDKSKAENDLREFARKLDLTLNVARIIPWRWDLVSGKISCEMQRMLTHNSFDANNTTPQIINIIDEEDYFSHIHPDDLQKIREKYNALINGKLQFTKLEYRYLWKKRGTLHTEWIEVNAGVNSRDSHGHPTGILGSMLIITQRKLQEEQLISARARAQESERLKSAFLANMSHEIRTPLNAIVGFSTLLTKTHDQAKRQKFINIIEDNNQLLLQLISDVLDLAKVESNTLDFTYHSTNLNELLGTIESTVQMRLQPGVALNLLLGLPQCHIETEPKRLSQVLINLLTNACKFTTKGNISFGYEIQENSIYFFVKDTGIGISDDDIPKLFERFVKLDTFVQGTGLGLSISKSIVEKLGGEIGVESRGKGKGTKFWFTIPYLKGDDNPCVEENVIVAKEQMKREELTILIAEDNESNYLLFQSILENDYKLIHAWDGNEAVKLYDQFRPALVIMDINLPGIDGYEATKQIRILSPDVPIIAVTAYAYASDQDKILESGFNSYVSKPVNPDKLTQELHSMISNRFLLI